MQTRFSRQHLRLISILVMIALASLAVRLLAGYHFHETALLYVGIPFLIALALIVVRPRQEGSWKRRFLTRLIDAFIIMFGSSVVLFEGFVCVVMFIPIYLFVISLVFLIQLIREHARGQGRGTLQLQAVPVLLVLASLEGVTPDWSFDRSERVSVSRVVAASVAQIHHNLQQPMDLQTARPWFLYLFPMPYAIKAGTLSQGDIHEAHFRYYRWFVTNMHEGHMSLELSTVEAHRIKAIFLEDTSYIANYLRLHGIEIRLDEIDVRHTRVTLQIEFERTLDPYWYFSPLTRYGVGQTAEFLLTEVIAREHS